MLSPVDAGVHIAVHHLPLLQYLLLIQEKDNKDENNIKEVVEVRVNLHIKLLVLQRIVIEKMYRHYHKLQQVTVLV